jgi:hypothetical protein
MPEQSLAHIIDAADPADEEDVAIRKLLVAALSEYGTELAHVTNGRSPLLNSCERGTRGTPWRLSVMRSPLRRRRSPLAVARTYWH